MPNSTLFVHAVLPQGNQEKATSLPGKPEEYMVDGQPFHFCEVCDGWIEGFTHCRKTNSLNPKMRSGRRGLEFFCQRCGTKLGFYGLVS